MRAVDPVAEVPGTVDPPAWRFRPRRAGIVNLWDYSEEEFDFSGGRLVLRGQNGSGKTKALELLFPFLLDANLAPQRLDPFSGTGRTMRDNLLYRPGRDTVIGYAWMEFARSGPPGGNPAPETVVIGAGLRAQRSDTRVASWYFTTDRPHLGAAGPGGWSLLDASRRPLTRRQLAELLGPAAVHDSATSYRRAVDDALFGVGADRYEALVQLVLFLRRPQLAKDLDLERLSATLSAGLRPLDDDLLAEGARSFEDLEAVQRELERLDRACRATRRFLGAYRQYVRVTGRHRAGEALDAGAAAAAAAAAVERAGQERDAAAQAHEEASAAARAASELRVRLFEERNALQRSEAYRNAGQLDDMRARVSDAADEVASARGRAADAASAAATAGERRDGEQRLLAAAEERRSRALNSLFAGAETAMAHRWDEVRSLGTLESEDLRRRLEVVCGARRTEMAEVRRALDGWESARADLERADEALVAAGAAADAAETALGEAEEGLARQRQELVAELTAWIGTARSGLAAPARPGTDSPDPGDLDPVELIAAAEGDRIPALEVIARGLLEPFRRAAERSLDRARVERDGVEVERAELLERREAIAGERDEEPPAPPLRADSREGRRGAPLWRLVDFVDSLGDGERAALEAGLEASGILDAWVHPGGMLDSGSSGLLDVHLVPGVPASGDGVPASGDGVPASGDGVPASGDGMPASGDGVGTLAEVLVPDPAAVHLVEPGVVARVLAAISVSPASGGGVPASGGEAAVVGTSGHFRIGPLVGAAAKDAPGYIGASARAERRRRRLETLDGQIQALDARRDALEGVIGQSEEVVTHIEAAIADLPPTNGVTAAVTTLDRAVALLAERRALSAEAGTRRLRCAERSTLAHDVLRRQGATLSLPVERAPLEEAVRALDSVEASGRELVTWSAEAERAARRVAELDADRVRAEAARDSTSAEVGRREETHRTLAAELSTIEDSLGAGAREVMAALDHVAAEITAATRANRTAEEGATEAAGRRQGAEVALERATLERAHLEDLQQAAMARLGVLGNPEVRPVLFDDVHDGTPGPTRSSEEGDDSWLVRLATAIWAATEQVAAGPERRQATKTATLNAFQQLEVDLGAAHHASLDDADDVILVRVADDDGRLSVAAFDRRITERRDEQQALLSAQEREVLENTLLDSLCRQLHERMGESREQVRQMNRALENRSTTSGKAVRLTWNAAPDVSAGKGETMRLLDADPVLMSQAARDSVREHLATEIRSERAASPQATYREILGRVLDYRSWRGFGIRITEDGEEKALTRKLYNKYSGGERATVLHLPLFAAAAAHYDSGRPDCPRLIALDEAFAGIDSTTTAELLGLSVEFDLDLFLTGHDLWATFAEVPEVSIVQLSHHRATHTVSSLKMRWDGARVHHES